MKIYLDSYSKFDCFFEHDIETGETSEAGNIRDGLICTGVADKLSQAYVGFYEYKSHIYFFVSGERVKLDENSRLEHQSLGELKKLTLTIGESVKAIVEYKVPKLLEDDFTPFVEEEDFDFGLFLVNVFSNKDRLSRVLKEMISRFPEN